MQNSLVKIPIVFYLFFSFFFILVVVVGGIDIDIEGQI